MSLSVGIVGLPNVGKSTLFNSLTKQQALAANYPFATIEPNHGIVHVPDERLNELAKIVNPGKIVPATVEFVDIAGLVEGANKGEGLGNAFLANIRETDAIVEVVRYFESGNIVHVTGPLDPEGDAEVIRTELVLADLATVEKALPRLEKETKKNAKDTGAKLEYETAKRLVAHLNENRRASEMEMTDDERASIYDLHLITMKPFLYVANVSDEQLGQELAPIDGITPIPICAQIEADLTELDDDEAKEYLSELGVEATGLDTLIRKTYDLLGLQYFFTAGEIEVKAWTIHKGDKAPQAAGVIHSDFEKGFIKAETISYEDYIAYQGEVGCRNAGRLRMEGKDYVVQDGDVMHFRFNV